MATQNASSKQSDDAYLKMRADYRARLADMIITIEDVWYADKTRNLLDGPKIRNGLEISIPKWDNPPPDDPAERDLLRLELDNGDGVFRLIGDPIPFQVNPGDQDFPPGLFPYKITIANDDLPRNATCRLRYTVEAYNNNIPTPSQITPLIVDQIAPDDDKEPVALELASSDLDDSNLPAGGKLPATLKGYTDWQATDRIAVYVVDANNLPDDPGVLTPIFAGLVPAPGTGDTTLSLDADEIRKVGDAEVVFFYLLQDAAKNTSPLSFYTKATVLVGPLPVVTALPEVPQADPVLYMVDAVDGISVWIDQYTNPKLGDQILVEWGGEPLSPFTVGVNPPAKFEVPVFPVSLVLKDYGPVNVGEKDTTVKYHVSRKGRLFGPRQAIFKVDMSTIIPWPTIPFPPDDWPDPVHPDLLEGEVKNHDGTRTNQLTRADKDEDAVFHFTWYSLVKNGHIVKFYWAGKEMPEAQVIFDDTQAGHVPDGDFTVVVPWKYIDEAGNGPTIPVHYAISGAGAGNPLESARTLVDVNAITLDLPEPDFPTFASQPSPNYPGCLALEPDGQLKISIPNLTGLLKVGDEIEIVFTPMKGTGLTNPDDPITAAIWRKTVKLGDAGTPLTGFDQLVGPYVDHIKPLYDENAASGRRGRVKLQYTFDDGNGVIESAVRLNHSAFHELNTACTIPRP